MEEVKESKIRLLKILKGVSIGVLLIVLVTILIFSYNKKKILYNYITSIDFDKINFKDNLNIEKKDADKYIEFENIKIRNDFDDYKEKQKTNDTYLITDEKTNSIYEAINYGTVEDKLTRAAESEEESGGEEVKKFIPRKAPGKVVMRKDFRSVVLPARNIK